MRKRFFLNPTIKTKTASPLWFSKNQIYNIINRYFTINDNRIGGLTNLKLNSQQKEIIDSLSDNVITIISKERQIGVSTAMQAALALLMSDPDTLIYYVSHSNNMKQRCKQQMMHFIECLKEFENDYSSSVGDSCFDVANEKVDFLQLSNNSRVKFITCNPTKMRGESPKFIYFDECDHRSVIETMRTIGPVMAARKGHRVIISAESSEAEMISHGVLIHHFNLRVTRNEFDRIKSVRIHKFYASPDFH